ncbi:SPFH domain-containing protein [Candidatus Riflebacteria bacterium]
MVIPWIYFLKEDEQVLVESFTERYTLNGPRVFVANPFQTVYRRKGITLEPTDYLRIKNTMTGELCNEMGPKLYFPTAREEIIKRLKCIPLKAHQYIVIIDSKNGSIRVERGEKSIYLSPTEEVLEQVTDGVNLGPTDYLQIKNKISGEIRNEFGPQLFFPTAEEEIVSSLRAIPLKHNQYIRIMDDKSGKIRVELGEKSVYLEPTEKILEETKDGINIDEHQAVLLRDTESGNLDLIIEPQVFFPRPNHEILQIRKKILLESHETAVVKDKAGNFIIKRGTEQASAFFLEPHCELVKFIWSAGIHKDKRDLVLTHLDARPKFMWYEFAARTQDNVELIIGITFFWQLTDVEAMLKTTDDTPGDICSHARSMIIQAISKEALEKVLASFNAIVKSAVLDPADSFYQERGVKLHSVEVRSITCKNPETQKILQEIIQETTDRLNKLQKQESENEIKIKSIKGDIEAEKMRSQYLKVRAEHLKAEAEMEGKAEAQKLKSFFDGLGKELAQEEKLLLFQTLKKNEALAKLSEGDAQLYFTPSDVNLSIETRRMGGDASTARTGLSRKKSK